MKLCSVDLIYLDPPFNSNRAYNAIYKDATGRPLPSQVNAFCDMWELNAERLEMLKQMPVLVRDSGIDNETVQFWKYLMNALRHTQPRLLAYLLYMVERLVVMKGLLRHTGSIYLHCDPTASHYIKVIMDGIFGHQNFRNEIVWCYEIGGRGKKSFGKKHDVIFLYSKTDKYVFNIDDVRLPRKKTNMKTEADENGKEWQVKKDKKTGKIYRYYIEKGVIPPDWWVGIQQLNRNSKERLGYPTQKPITLLKRILKASSNEGDVVLDPFCGCATTICAAHELNRKWIGIDIAYHAIKRAVQNRLEGNYRLVEGKHYEIDGVPNSLEGARHIWERDHYQFQRWVIEYIDGFVTSKKTNDGGVDGEIYFDNGTKYLQTMILEVKGGKHVNIGVVRDLKGTMERRGMPMAGLIVLEDLTDRKRGNFELEMTSAGMLEVHGKQYPRMQMLTTKEILDDKRFEMPGIVKMARGQVALEI